MYNLNYFKASDPAAVIAFMNEHSFTMVTGIADGYPVSSHLPLEIIERDGEIYFAGHLMRNTDHHIAFEKNNKVLVVFNSPHAYIDAGWYNKPGQASTVNYMAVHVNGIISFGNDVDTITAVRQITDKHIGPGTPASFDQLPEKYIAALLKQIVSFSIKANRIDHVFKLSQNMSMADRQSIITHLQKRQQPGDLYIADRMKENL
jgi:transcriptional regulator